MGYFCQLEGAGVALVFGHADFAGHVTPPGHPERVERHAAVMAGLPGGWLEAPLAAEAEVLRCHPAAYVARMKAM
ncbi:MAG: hypothetical protein ACRC14_01370, partial [Paracoccaceae bacterium]